MQAVEPTPAPALSRQLVLARLAREMATLGDMAEGLQEALHRLPLAASDGPTRKVLQSADMLTQSLACVCAALDGLADEPGGAAADLARVLDGVFLDDLRTRLIGGDPLAAPRTPPGEVDFF